MPPSQMAMAFERLLKHLRTFSATRLRLGIDRQTASQLFIGLLLRRKDGRDLLPLELDSEESDRAIVLQGPILLSDEFTVTSIEAYRSWFPNDLIVLSTWDGEDQGSLDRAEALGCEIVLSEKNSVAPGPSNQNLQMITTRAGLLKAHEKERSSVIKLRTDQRVNNRMAFDALSVLSRVFPLEGEVGQQGRIIVPSLNTFMFRPYGVTDMLMYGGIDDMLSYWDGYLDSRAKASPDSDSLRDFSKMRVAEVAFCSRFLEKKGEELTYSLEHYWSVLARRFLVIDQAFFDLHWPKYTAIENRWGSWKSEPRFAEVSFAMWLLLKEGAVAADENLLDLPQDVPPLSI